MTNACFYSTVLTSTKQITYGYGSLYEPILPLDTHEDMRSGELRPSAFHIFKQVYLLTAIEILDIAHPRPVKRDRINADGVSCGAV